MRKVTYEAPTDAGADPVGKVIREAVRRPKKKAKSKPKVRKVVKAKKKAKSKPKVRKVVKAKKKAKSKPAPKKGVVAERLDIKLSKTQKAKLLAKAKKTSRTVTSIMLELIDKMK
jgi:hypothetical protein